MLPTPPATQPPSLYSIYYKRSLSITSAQEMCNLPSYMHQFTLPAHTTPFARIHIFNAVRSDHPPDFGRQYPFVNVKSPFARLAEQQWIYDRITYGKGQIIHIDTFHGKYAVLTVQYESPNDPGVALYRRLVIETRLLDLHWKDRLRSWFVQWTQPRVRYMQFSLLPTVTNEVATQIQEHVEEVSYTMLPQFHAANKSQSDLI